MNLVASLWEQLIVNRENHLTLSGTIKSLHEKHCNRRSRPSLEEVLALLRTEIAGYRKVYIVVDALDECLDDGAGLLEGLATLKLGVRLMFTSRPHVRLDPYLHNIQRSTITAQHVDLDKYLVSRVSRIGLVAHDRAKAPRLWDAIRKDKQFSAKIVDRIISRAKGMSVYAIPNLCISY